jgi:hypothetical protein
VAHAPARERRDHTTDETLADFARRSVPRSRALGPKSERVFLHAIVHAVRCRA